MAERYYLYLNIPEGLEASGHALVIAGCIPSTKPLHVIKPFVIKLRGKGAMEDGELE